MQAAGHHLNTLFLCGGLSKNPLFVQMHADITGKPVVLSKEVESVLVGAAILGACASGDFASIQQDHWCLFLCKGDAALHLSRTASPREAGTSSAIPSWRPWRKWEKSGESCSLTTSTKGFMTRNMKYF
uniref:Carbohydrate kinase FGGY C-terminal domain-containing protein n=1 Tax=Anas platyrhynchos platyrhynchos TaxID=8840 RepID=A0A493TVA9_ANAPP